MVQARHKDRLYFVEHRNGRFYILTNDNAPNYKVMTAPIDNPGYVNWQAFIPHDPDKLIEGFELFTTHIVTFGRSQALPTIDVHDFSTGKTNALTFPEAVYATRGAANPEFNAESFRFVYTSMTTADSTYDVKPDYPRMETDQTRARSGWL